MVGARISALLNLQPEPAAAQQGSEHLIACNLQEAASLFALIRNVLPVVNVLFDLGRGGESVGNGELEAYRLVDMLRHARLKSMEQLAVCLQAINEAICRIRNDPNATFYILDDGGHCLIATTTQRSIAGVWQQLVGGQGLAGAPAADDPKVVMGPPHSSLSSPVSGTVPPSFVHLAGSFPIDDPTARTIVQESASPALIAQSGRDSSDNQIERSG